MAETSVVDNNCASSRDPDTGSLVWSPELEVCLFHAMIGHKPVGVNRHFHMICIRDKFSQNIGRQVPSKVLWDHLNTFYDIQALNESEVLPFPNTEWPFSLPEEIRAMRERKDGVNRHFEMMIIRDKFSEKIGRQVPSKVLWDRLNTFYDLEALNKSEVLPFPNNEQPFSLPEEIMAVRASKNVKGGEGFNDMDKPSQPCTSAEKSKMVASVSLKDPVLKNGQEGGKGSEKAKPGHLRTSTGQNSHPSRPRGVGKVTAVKRKQRVPRKGQEEGKRSKKAKPGHPRTSTGQNINPSRPRGVGKVTAVKRKQRVPRKGQEEGKRSKKAKPGHPRTSTGQNINPSRPRGVGKVTAVKRKQPVSRKGQEEGKGSKKAKPGHPRTSTGQNINPSRPRGVGKVTAVKRKPSSNLSGSSRVLLKALQVHDSPPGHPTFMWCIWAAYLHVVRLGGRPSCEHESRKGQEEGKGSKKAKPGHPRTSTGQNINPSRPRGVGKVTAVKRKPSSNLSGSSRVLLKALQVHDSPPGHPTFMWCIWAAYLHVVRLGGRPSCEHESRKGQEEGKGSKKAKPGHPRTSTGQNINPSRPRGVGKVTAVKRKPSSNLSGSSRVLLKALQVHDSPPGHPTFMWCIWAAYLHVVRLGGRPSCEHESRKGQEEGKGSKKAKPGHPRTSTGQNINPSRPRGVGKVTAVKRKQPLSKKGREQGKWTTKVKPARPKTSGKNSNSSRPRGVSKATAVNRKRE
uniref:MRG/MORF4L-binding protein n=1 Tax=Myxine glutinosa TaxID=7769 RepID=UPI00358F7C59